MKCLVAVGSAITQDAFEADLSSWLYPPWAIKHVIPLDFEDDQKNFLAYVDAAGKETDEEAADNVAAALGGDYDVTVCDSSDEAVEYAAEHYSEIAFEAFTDPITSAEIFKRDILVGLIHTGEIAIVRALFNKRPIIALVHNSIGQGDNPDHVMTPLAIMVDDVLGPQIELPVKSSYKT